MDMALHERYKKILDKALRKYHETQCGHVGGGISVLPVLTTLFQTVFDAAHDKLIFSKGHNALALYTCLNIFGFLSNEEFETFYQDNTRLGGHPPKKLTNFCPFATGSLGHGPSLANGLALAKKIKREAGHIYCICGDGEWQEGSCWEALIFCVKHKLSNLTIIIDCNEWQGFDACIDVAGYNAHGLKSRVHSFGALTHICDGHNFEELSFVLSQQNSFIEVPQVIFIQTTKAYGIPHLENTLDSHYKPISDEIYQLIRRGEK